jgi:hypothetical protein
MSPDKRALFRHIGAERLRPRTPDAGRLPVPNQVNFGRAGTSRSNGAKSKCSVQRTFDIDGTPSLKRLIAILQRCSLPPSFSFSPFSRRNEQYES